jgi:uncharacterized protein (DUF1015 family)
MKIKPFRGSLLQSSLVENVPHFLYELRNGFSKKLQEKYYLRTKKPCYFIYQIIKNGLSHQGLIVQNSPEDLFNHKIYKHELILPNKLGKIKGLISSSGSMIKPIMLFHKPIEELNEILNNQIGLLPLVMSIALDDEVHNIFVLTDKEVLESISSIFEKEILEAFIADGHHRFESISQLMEEGAAMNPPQTINMLSAYFASDMLNVVPIHRLVHLPSDIDNKVLKNMLKSIGKLKKVKELSQPEKKYTFGVAFGTKQYKVKFKKSIIRKYKAVTNPSLPVQILESELNKALENLTNDKMEIEYILGDTSTKKKVEMASGMKMTILLPPIRLKDIMKISRQGLTLPAKSTWFTPKVRSGLIIGKI